MAKVRYEPSIVLQRALVLERRQGYLDRSAVGGLAGFARQQVERSSPGERATVERVAAVLADYSGSDLSGRTIGLDAALSILQRTEAAPDAASGLRLSEPRASEPSPVPMDRVALHREPKAIPDGKGLVARPATELDDPLMAIKSFRKQMADGLHHLGVTTIRELLYYFPRAHYDYADTRSISRMRAGQKSTLVGTIEHVRTQRFGRGTAITFATVSDDTGSVRVRWFNQPYLVKVLRVGARVAISGQPEINRDFLSFVPRDYEILEVSELTHTGRLVPMYPLTKGLHQRSLRAQMHSVVQHFAPLLEEHLPSEIIRKLNLPELSVAIQQYHFPDSEERRRRAEQRLAFDELLLVELGLLRRKEEWQTHDPLVAIEIDHVLHQHFRSALPFALTGAQERVLGELFADMRRPVAMTRLLQGDVGSGKTVVAAAAMLQAVHAGKQAVLMAPTEILAEQHHATLQTLLNAFGIDCRLLSGSSKKAEKRTVYEACADGSAQAVIGTHALIQQGLEFASLGLVITDEQHRFGVEQRATLRDKGIKPHLLSMTATPIPRTLAMTIYGDSDVSQIDEMPPGRLGVKTSWQKTNVEAYGLVRAEVNKGRQAFVICPVIEESADSDMRSVLREHQELSTLTFADLEVGLLHGKMKPSEKESTLSAFRAGAFQVLVATSVIEVGIDIPNATIMVIRDAHRFGLAQLHQFRGRVGRGSQQSFCVLLSDSEDEGSRQRLHALISTDDGFKLAEADLRLRGPGEFWGTRQSGLPELRVATLGDVPTIERAREAALEMLRADPDLREPRHTRIAKLLNAFWATGADHI
ncbi:MAG: ATP-dependent DNA helicase RecG [Chloroflexota bacterium]